MFETYVEHLDDIDYLHARAIEAEVTTVVLEALGRHPTAVELAVIVPAALAHRAQANARVEDLRLAIAKVLPPDLAGAVAARVTIGLDIWQLQPNLFWAWDTATTALAALPEPLRTEAKSSFRPVYSATFTAITDAYVRPAPSGRYVILLHGGAMLFVNFALLCEWSKQRFVAEYQALGRDRAARLEQDRFCALAREFLDYDVVDERAAAVDAAADVFEAEFNEDDVVDTRFAYAAGETESSA